MSKNTEEIIAKFRLSENTISVYGERIKMEAIHDDGIPENKSFSEATPSGSLEMFVNNKGIKGFFDVGSDYYLTLRKAPAVEK